MLKKLFTALFGSTASPQAPQVTPTEYQGYLIYPEPMAEGGQFRLTGRITREIEGELKEHRFIRSDLFVNPNDARDFMLRKAQTFIDQTGDKMFEPRPGRGA